MENIIYDDVVLDALAQEVFDVMRPRVSDDDMQLIIKAYRFARNAHGEQKRKNGKPYITHPIAVALIVAKEMDLDTNPVCAAFLHDVVEDTPVKIFEIEREFGSDIAKLVDAVTKKLKEKYTTSKQVDNFRQMLDSVNYDVRALLLKLADRLHNMRTLSSMAPEKQMKIAGETDFFYAPLANRLGLYKVKTELENLSFSFRCPREYAQIETLRQNEIQNIRPYLEEFSDKIREGLKNIDIQAELSIETRGAYSIRKKMLQTNTDFMHLEGLHSVNIVYDVPEGLSEKRVALRIYAMLTDMFEERPHSFVNFIDHPKENGYQSLHVKLLAGNGHWQEVHIASRRMKQVQELGYIAAKDDASITKWIGRLKWMLQDMSSNEQATSFMDGIEASFYTDDITVFTAEGRTLTLPQKATAIDFAFEIAPEIGLHAQYARINGKIESLRTELKRGDLVEIHTEPMAHPYNEWLDHVNTYNAKSQIKNWLSQQPASPLIRCEHCNPLPGDEVIGFRNDDKPIIVHKRDCRIAISEASAYGDNVVAVVFPPTAKLYRVSVHIKAIDRQHLLSDLIDCISNELKLSIINLTTTTKDFIVDCDIEFKVHSYFELQTVIKSLNSISNVDQVWYNEHAD